MEHAGSTVRQLISQLDDALDKQTRKSEQFGGLNPVEVIGTIKGILGGKASLPPNPGPAFYGFVKSRTKFLNVSLQDVEKAAVHVRSHWKLPTSVEWIIRKLDTILTEAEEMENRVEVDEDGWTLVTGREGLEDIR
jgi:hypothetical protein